MSVTFTNARYFRTSSNQVLWDNQSSASLSFFFRYEIGGSTNSSDLNYTPLVGDELSAKLWCAIVGGSSGSVTIKNQIGIQGIGTVFQQTTLAQASTYHIAVTHAQGAQTVWVNGISSTFSWYSANTNTWNGPFQLGGTPPGSPVIYTMSDVALWNGYALTDTDVANLRDGNMSPSQIGGSASTRVEWTLAGSSGLTPQLGDGGLANTFGNTDYDLISIAGSGSAVYSAPLIFTPSAGIQTAYVGTSGKTVVIFFENVATSYLTMPTESITAPTVFKNGINLGQLINVWLTGYHQCVVYCLPAGTSVKSGDTVALTAPIGWMNTNAGITQALNDFSITNHTGKSAFCTESLSKTLKIGLNFSDSGTGVGTLYQIPKNWRYRLANWGWGGGAFATPDGYPTTTTNTAAGATICGNFTGNTLDSTSYPVAPGLYAVGWDDLNPSVPTSCYLYATDWETTTVSERTDLANPGDVNGNGKVRVFDIQQAAGSTVVSLRFEVWVQNSNKTPQFANLVVYQPGDFNYQDNVPVVLDRSDPYAFSATFQDRTGYSLGSARWMDSYAGSGGWTNLSEPEEGKLLTDFTWGSGNTKFYNTIGYTQFRPYSTSVSPYVYSSFLGTPFTATLASNIDASTTTLTISDAATAPVLIGLTLTIDSEIMRVLNVSGTTVTVGRGAANTTPTPHSSGPIQVNNRYAIPSLSFFGGVTTSNSSTSVVELVTQGPHGLKTGQWVEYNAGSWPQPTFTDNTTLFNLSYNRNIVLVTGANSYVSVWGGATSGPVTLSGVTTISDNALNCTRILPDVGFPYEFISLATGKVPGCDLHVNLPTLASDTLIDSIARHVRDNFPAGRNVWIELSNEPWNNAFIQNLTVNWMSYMAYPGEGGYGWVVSRTGEACQRFRDRFNENSLNRAGEIKSLINIQAVGPFSTTIVLGLATAKNIGIDAIAIGLYADPDASAASVTAWNAADDEQAIDLWIHDLYYCTTGGWTGYLAGHNTAINSYNTANGKECMLYGYEGGVQTTTPGDYALQRGRDMIYNPSWYIIEQDFYAFLQNNGYQRHNMYSYSLYFLGVTNWGIYHTISQDHGRGDGSDGKLDNRLCLATPGKPNTKASTTNQEQHTVSVRGQALIDWMRSMSPPRKPRSSIHRQH